MKNYLAEIECRVAGIPCRLGVISYYRQRGSFNYHADSDLDYSGYVEAEWDVLDRRGRPAPWLETKVTRKDTDNFYELISENMESDHGY